MKLILIRHADPDYENDTITPLGHEQARALADALAGERIDEIFVSPYGRAQATMNYVAEKKNMTATRLPWLGELDGCYAKDADGQGLWAWSFHGVDLCASSGVSMENWKTRVPEAYAEKITRVAETMWNEFNAFMASRGIIRDGARYRVENTSDSFVAFFCHEGFIKTLLSHLLQVPLPVAYSQMMIAPSSRTVLSLEEKNGYGVFRLQSLNELIPFRSMNE